MTAYAQDHQFGSVGFSVTIGFWVLLELRQAIRRRPEATRADRHSLGLMRVTLVGGWLLAVASRAELAGATIGGGVVVFVIGGVIAWCGIALRVWSTESLGRWFTIAVMTSADQPVIDTGPYRWLRHPSYSGLILILIGAGVMFGNWAGLAVIVIPPTIGLLLRIRVEERVLMTNLGAAYRDFADGRKRLIPRVW